MKTTRTAVPSTPRLSPSTARTAPRAPTMRAVADTMADALAADASLTAEVRALYNALHDALCAANAIASGTSSPRTVAAIREAGERAHVAAISAHVTRR